MNDNELIQDIIKIHKQCIAEAVANFKKFRYFNNFNNITINRKHLHLIIIYNKSII